MSTNIDIIIMNQLGRLLDFLAGHRPEDVARQHHVDAFLDALAAYTVAASRCPIPTDPREAAGERVVRRAIVERAHRQIAAAHVVAGGSSTLDFAAEMARRGA